MLRAPTCSGQELRDRRGAPARRYLPSAALTWRCRRMTASSRRDRAAAEVPPEVEERPLPRTADRLPTDAAAPQNDTRQVIDAARNASSPRWLGGDARQSRKPPRGLDGAGTRPIRMPDTAARFGVPSTSVPGRNIEAPRYCGSSSTASGDAVRVFAAYKPARTPDRTAECRPTRGRRDYVRRSPALGAAGRHTFPPWPPRPGAPVHSLNRQSELP